MPDDRTTNLFRFSFILFLLAISFVFSAHTADDRVLAKWEEEFMNPPMDCRPYTYWWWLGNAVTKDEITWEMEQMCEKGIGIPLVGCSPASVSPSVDNYRKE